MTKRLVRPMSANGSRESILPLRGYLLSVGGALLVLLLVADWVLPAPLPDRFAQLEPAMPPIRIASDVKTPERVDIDTNQHLPSLAENEIGTVVRQPESWDAPDATREASASATVDDDDSRPITSLTVQVRNSLAQALPGHDSGASREQATVRTSRPKHKSSHARSRLEPRSAEHSAPDHRLGWCSSACRDDRTNTVTLFRLD